MTNKPSSGKETGSSDNAENNTSSKAKNQKADSTDGAGATSKAKATKSQKDSSQKKSASDSHEAKAEPWVSEETISHFFERIGDVTHKIGDVTDKIGDVTSSAFKLAKKTTDTSYKVGKAIIQSQDQLKLMVSAGQSLKDLREVAGLTVNELSDAINLKDKTLLEAVENGTATLSFELILRLSALLARNDPIPFILKYSRTYSPETWKLLNDWGAGRLPLQYQREREFINIFRSQDQARSLSDEGFNKVLEFTRESFNLSLHFIAEQEQQLSELRESILEELKAELSEESDNTAESDNASESHEQETNPGKKSDDDSAV